MAKLEKVPQWLLDMSNEDLMHWELEDEYDDKGNLVREGMITKAIEWGVMDDLEALLDETSTKMRYPRMAKWDEEKQKTVYVADKSKPKYESVSAVGFFEVKAKFIHEVCGLPSLAKPVEKDFRTKIREAAAKARAAKEAAAKIATAEEKADAKVAEIFGKK